MVLEGYALLFNQETLIGDETKGYIESIDAHALDLANMKDVPLKLIVDEIGLKVRAELIDTESNKDIYKMVKAGLLDKMSFAFTVKSQKFDRTGNLPKRIILEIDRLYDVSIVDVPAYDQTSITVARSLGLVDTELEAMDLELQKQEAELIRKRIQIKTKI